MARRTSITVIMLISICTLFSVLIALADDVSLENNVDRPGSDYASFNLGGGVAGDYATTCRDICAGDPECKALSIVKPGVQGPNGRCSLKNAVPNPVPNNNCISGVKTSAAQADLTGMWNCDDGGKYYIRQLGNEIWWYGEANPDSSGWSNVMHGTISGNTINGKWADVPKGATQSDGTINLNIESNNRLNVIQKTGGFAGSVWTR